MRRRIVCFTVMALSLTLFNSNLCWTLYSASKVKWNLTSATEYYHRRHVPNFADRFDSILSIQIASTADGKTHGIPYTWNTIIYHNCFHRKIKRHHISSTNVIFHRVDDLATVFDVLLSANGNKNISTSVCLSSRYNTKIKKRGNITEVIKRFE